MYRPLHVHEEYGWAQQESIQCQVLPSDWPYQENPTDPAGSPQSTQPASWATTLGSDVMSCRCTPAIVEGMPVHQTWPIWGQVRQQTQACLASEGWCPSIHNQSNFSHQPVHHKTIRVHTKKIPVCTSMHPVHTGMYWYAPNTNKYSYTSWNITVLLPLYATSWIDGWAWRPA